jgi:hypothetical protein
MSDQPVWVSQTELICALLAELDRQYPGARVNESAMDAIIQAATLVKQATNAGGLTRPESAP